MSLAVGVAGFTGPRCQPCVGLELGTGWKAFGTEARRLAGRLRFACLPTPATLEDFDYDAASGVDPHLIADLATGHYLESATNILMIGPPGVGKTHLAVGLARKAAESGYRTYVTTAADLAARCHRAAIEGRWATTMRFFAGPTLLVGASPRSWTIQNRYCARSAPTGDSNGSAAGTTPASLKKLNSSTIALAPGTCR